MFSIREPSVDNCAIIRFTLQLPKFSYYYDPFGGKGDTFLKLQKQQVREIFAKSDLRPLRREFEGDVEQTTILDYDPKRLFMWADYESFKNSPRGEIKVNFCMGRSNYRPAIKTYDDWQKMPKWILPSWIVSHLENNDITLTERFAI